jgi:hypothetical protein
MKIASRGLRAIWAARSKNAFVKTQGKGMADQVAGQAADATQWVRNAIETQPYTNAIVALGIGWLLGRMHLPS